DGFLRRCDGDNAHDGDLGAFSGHARPQIL
ncbi:MAG: hypothetical protein AVDCRST_MAG55-1049, partial [uncultured Rubrobacteraceae bacterium]